MGHYDNCRPENCAVCGQAIGFCEHTKRPAARQVQMQSFDGYAVVDSTGECGGVYFSKDFAKDKAKAPGLFVVCVRVEQIPQSEVNGDRHD